MFFPNFMGKNPFSMLTIFWYGDFSVLVDMAGVLPCGPQVGAGEAIAARTRRWR